MLLDGSTISNLSAPNSLTARYASFFHYRSASPRPRFDEVCGGNTRAGIELGHIAIECRDKFPPLLIVVRLIPRVTPGREIIPARAAGSFRIRGYHSDARPNQVRPVFDAFRVAFTDQEDDGRGIRCAVLRQAFLPGRIEDMGLIGYIDVIGQGKGDDIGLEAVNG
jgi:hypothetical protein